MPIRRVLLVANKTAHGPKLREAVKARMAEAPTHFVLLVPAEPPKDSLTFEESACWKEAQARANEVVRELERLGASVEGRVGDHSPYEAVLDLLRVETFDEIIVSTLPPGLSAWLGLDLPTRLRHATTTRLTHVVHDPNPVAPNRIEGEVHVDTDRPVGRY